MTTWSEISRDNLAAAGELMRAGRHRSSVSRAYYAAFAAVAQALAKRGFEFAQDRKAPSHTKLRQMVRQNIRLSRKPQRELLAVLNELYKQRISADYRPDHYISCDEARTSVITATRVLTIIGIK